MFYRYKPQFYEAFRKALERPEPFPNLSAWARRARALTLAVYRAADEQGLDLEARRAIILHLDKRDISMETILATILHHVQREYPYLLGERGRFNEMVLHASNLNDRYLIHSLAQVEALQQQPLKGRIDALCAHLDNIPSEAS